MVLLNPEGGHEVRLSENMRQREIPRASLAHTERIPPTLSPAAPYPGSTPRWSNRTMSYSYVNESRGMSARDVAFRVRSAHIMNRNSDAYTRKDAAGTRLSPDYTGSNQLF